MAVSIVSSPNALSPVANGWQFVFNLSDSGTLPEVRQAVYALYDGAGALIKDLDISRPVGGGNFAIDFKEDIKGELFAALPPFGASGVQNDNTLMKSFKVQFGEKIINVETGAVTTSLSFSDTYKVLGGANNVMDNSFITDSTPKLLTYRPKEYGMFKDSDDWVWLLGNGTAMYHLYDEDGALLASQVLSAPYEMNAIPLGLESLGYLVAYPNANVLKVQIQAGALDETYEIDFDEYCKSSKEDFIEILFQEPLGGRSVAVFQKLDNIGVNIQQNEVLINRDILYSTNLRIDGGNSISYKESRLTFSCAKEIKGDKTEISWLQGFLGATEYHIKIYDENGDPYWTKFILDSGSVSWNDKSLSVSGHLAMPVIGSLNP